MPVSERERWLEDEFQEVVGDPTKPTIEVRGLDEPDAELVIGTWVVYPGRRRLIDASFMRERDAWLARFEKFSHTGNRHLSYLHAGLRVSSEIEYDLCPEVSHRFHGAQLDFESEFGALKRRWAQRGRQFMTVTTELTLPPALVGVAAIEAYNRFLEVITAEGEIWFDFEPAAGAKGTP
jgi:hypothetical protein